MFTGSALYNPLNVVLVPFYNQLVGSFSWNHMVNIYNSRCLYFVQDYMTIGGGLGWHLRPCVWMLWTEILGLQHYVPIPQLSYSIKGTLPAREPSAVASWCRLLDHILWTHAGIYSVRLHFTHTLRIYKLSFQLKCQLMEKFCCCDRASY